MEVKMEVEVEMKMHCQGFLFSQLDDKTWYGILVESRISCKQLNWLPGSTSGSFSTFPVVSAEKVQTAKWADKQSIGVINKIGWPTQ